MKDQVSLVLPMIFNVGISRVLQKKRKGNLHLMPKVVQQNKMMPKIPSVPLIYGNIFHDNSKHRAPNGFDITRIITAFGNLGQFLPFFDIFGKFIDRHIQHPPIPVKIGPFHRQTSDLRNQFFINLKIPSKHLNVPLLHPLGKFPGDIGIKSVKLLNEGGYAPTFQNSPYSGIFF